MLPQLTAGREGPERFQYPLRRGQHPRRQPADGRGQLPDNDRPYRQQPGGEA
ncbi:Uncharacterised protein [Klebsiella pneumoniae]|nr:Uncharacterised protein [Klebsiella pneumoniae]